MADLHFMFRDWDEPHAPLSKNLPSRLSASSQRLICFRLLCASCSN